MTRAARPERDVLLPGRGRPEVRIVVVDDHPSYRRALASVIELTANARFVGSAATMMEARSLVNRNDVDLALVDIQLRDGSGIDLAREWAATSPATCVLLISSLAETALPADIATCGSVGFIRKDRFGSGALTAVCTAEGLLAAE